MATPIEPPVEMPALAPDVSPAFAPFVAPVFAPIDAPFADPNVTSPDLLNLTDPVAAPIRGDDVVSLYKDLTDSYNVLFCAIIAVAYVLILSMLYLVISRPLIRNKKDFRMKIAIHYSQSKLPLIVVVLTTLLSAYSCALFIWIVTEIARRGGEGQTSGEISEMFTLDWLIWTEFASSLLALIEYTLSYVLSGNKGAYVFNPFQFATVLSAVPGIIGPAITFYYYGFLFLRFLVVYKSLYALKRYGWNPFSELIANVILVVATVISLVLSISGFFFIYENIYLNHPNSFGQAPKIDTYFTAVYFIIITLTTVGYGDYSPVSRLGKVAVMIGIVGSLWLLPPQVSAVFEALQAWKAASVYSKSEHIVVYCDNEAVSSFLSDFYQAKRSVANNMLVMTPRELDEETLAIIHQPYFKLRISEARGVLAEEDAVRRAKIEVAQACFIVVNKFARDSAQQDAEAILAAVSARNAKKNLAMYMQINQAVHKLAIPAQIHEVVCLESLRELVLIQNLLAPGMLSLIAVLLTVKPSEPASYVPAGDYNTEWAWGQSQQFETTVDMTKLRDMLFTDVCHEIFESYGALMIGIRSPTSQGFMLFPGHKYKIQYGDQGVFIFREGRTQLQACVDSPILFQQLKLIKSKFSSKAAAALNEDGDLRPNDLIDGVSSAFSQVGLQPRKSDDVSASTSSDEGWSNSGDRKQSDDEKEEAEIALDVTARGGISPEEESANRRRSMDIARTTRQSIDASRNPRHSIHSPISSGAFSDGGLSSSGEAEGLPESWDPTLRCAATIDLKGHIILCGRCDTTTFNLARHLLKRMKASQPLVLMLNKDSTQLPKFATEIGMFANQFRKKERVHFLVGEQLDPVDFRRASSTTAEAILCLPDSVDLETHAGKMSQDANSLVAFHLLKQFDAFTCIELINSHNSTLLGNERMASPSTGFYFASGNIFRRDIFDAILSQAYYKPGIVKVVESLCSAHVECVKIGKDLWEVLGGSVTFLQMFRYMLKKKSMLLLGVYRMQRESDPGEETSSSTTTTLLKATEKGGLLSSAKKMAKEKLFKSRKGGDGERKKSSTDRLPRYVYISPPPLAALFKSDMLYLVSHK